MYTRLLRYLLWGNLFLALAVACGTLPFAQATPTPMPTSTPTATATPQPSPTPTRTATPSATPQPTPKPLLENEEYQHSDGWIAFFKPAGWHIAWENPYGVEMRSPSGQSWLTIHATHTGQPVTDQALSNFAEAVAANLTSPDFQRSDAIFESEWAEIRGTMTWLEPGNIRMVHFYDDHTVISWIFFLADSDAERWSGLLDAIFEEGFVYDTIPIREHPLYAIRMQYTAPNELFELTVPLAWMIFSEEADSETWVETFVAPTADALIDVIVISLEEGEVDIQAAGKVTLLVMREFYGQDLRVTDDQVLPDGRERLTWTTGAHRGITFFDVPTPSTYLFLTVGADKDKWELYAPMFDEILETYEPLTP